MLILVETLKKISIDGLLSLLLIFVKGYRYNVITNLVEHSDNGSGGFTLNHF